MEEQLMKKVARVLSTLSAFLSALTLVYPKGKWTAPTLGWMKPFIAAASPFLALVGGLGALVGLLCRDLVSMWAGLFGAVVAVQHVARVIAPHDGFDRAFGPGWQAHIAPGLRARMMPQRYTPLPADPPLVPYQRDVVFGTHVETGDPLLADLWQPPDGVPRTGLAVVYLHGSAWHYADKDFGTRRFFRHLAAQGHVIMDVAYTLAPKARLHAMVADVKRAVAWMKANATTYGVKPERIVLMGGSAGGHLALLAAYTPNHPELQPADVETDTSVRAVVSYYGLPDLQASQDFFEVYYSDVLTGKTPLERSFIAGLGSLFRRTGFLPDDGRFVTTVDMLPGLLGGGPDQVPELYRLGSPVNHVGPHCPPTLQLQGGHDIAGMMPDVRRLHWALCDAGVLSVHVEFPNTDHGFDLFFPKWSPAAQAATYDTERFLALMV
jgi:acetyl esterase/lipase